MNKKPLIVGLTGSIATGKSAVGDILVAMGYAVLDTDKVSRDLSIAGGVGYDEIRHAFPDALDANRDIDRKKLAGIVFADEKKLAMLEKILHPKIAKVRQEFYHHHADDKMVFVMVPLLLEKNINQECHRVVVIIAPPERQKQWVLARPMMTEQLFAMIKKRQMSDADKMARADVVINNDGNLDDLKIKVAEAIKKLQSFG